MSDADNVLYFPTIEFQSDEWLKSASFVWEHVYRIVPAIRAERLGVRS